MEYLLVLIILATLLCSFSCSVSEAALYSVPPSYVKLLEEEGKQTGQWLSELKSEIDRPIAAVLILNTLANTLGPTIAGAIAGMLWGQSGVLAVAAILTVLILLFGEIVPKVLGVTYAKTAAPLIAPPLLLLMWVLRPVIWLTTKLSSSLRPDATEPTISHEEVKSFAELGTEEGALDEFEGEVIQNVIELDEVLVRDILTPRVVATRLREDLTLGEVASSIDGWSHTRVPIFDPEDSDHLTGYVLQRDLYQELLRGNLQKKLKELSRPLTVVPELLRADRLLQTMVENREQICGVVDEHGSLAGIVTLEDLLEELIGEEILDEYDTVTDMRASAGLPRVPRPHKPSSEISVVKLKKAEDKKNLP